MSYQFEVFHRKQRARPRGLVVTIYRTGNIRLSRDAVAALGSPKFVDLLFVPGRRVYGIRASTSNDAYACREHGISARSFLVENNLIPSEPSVKIPAYMQDSILVYTPNTE